MAPEYPSTPPLGFTDAWIRDLPAPQGRTERSDRGLCIRIEPTGAKIFRWYYFVSGEAKRKPRCLTLGPWAYPATSGHLTVGEARTWLGRIKEAHKGGVLPTVEAQLRTALGQGQARAPATTGKTVKDIAKDFYELRILPKRKSTPEQVKRTLDKDILPAIGQKELRAVTPGDCRDIVRAVVRRGSPSQAGKVFDHLDFLFRWARGSGEDLPVNPMENLDKEALGVVNNARDRFLSEEEIPLYWHAVEKLGRNGQGHSRPIQLGLRLMLLVPERTGQLLQGEWPEVDFSEAIWTVPIAHQKLNPRTKKKPRPRRITLAPRVLEIFGELRDMAGTSPFIMTSPESESGRFNPRALIRALTSLTATKRQAEDGKKIAVKPLLDLPGGHLTVHDLRHTFRTLAVEKLSLSPFVAEQCLAHSEGAMAGRYNHYDYLRERREALERWTEYVYRLVEPASTNVAFLPGRAERG